MLAPHELECQQCGSRYWVTSEHVNMRDDDTLDCHVCGMELLSWNEARMYSVELTHRAPVAAVKLGCIRSSIFGGRERAMRSHEAADGADPVQAEDTGA